MTNYEWDDILIIGDSYTFSRTDEYHWPQQLTLLLTKNNYNPLVFPRGKGFPGCSWWSTRKQLQLDLKYRMPKILVFVHTSTDRLPSDYDISLNPNALDPAVIMLSDQYYKKYNIPDNKDYEVKKKFAVALEMYYKHLYSEEFCNWSTINWYKEYDELVKDIPIVINLQLELRSKLFYYFKSGITVKESLLSITSDFSAGIPNHFSNEENLKFADKLYYIINNYKNNTVASLNW